MQYVSNKEGMDLLFGNRLCVYMVLIINTVVGLCELVKPSLSLE